MSMLFSWGSPTNRSSLTCLNVLEPITTVLRDGVELTSNDAKEDMERLPITNSVTLAQLFNTKPPVLFVNESSPITTLLNWGSPFSSHSSTFEKELEPISTVARRGTPEISILLKDFIEPSLNTNSVTLPQFVKEKSPQSPLKEFALISTRFNFDNPFNCSAFAFMNEVDPIDNTSKEGVLSTLNTEYAPIEEEPISTDSNEVQFITEKAPFLLLKLFDPITTDSSPLNPDNTNESTFFNESEPMVIVASKGTALIVTLLKDLIEPSPTTNSLTLAQFVSEKMPSTLVMLFEPITARSNPLNPSSCNALKSTNELDPIRISSNNGTPEIVSSL